MTLSNRSIASFFGKLSILSCVAVVGLNATPAAAQLTGYSQDFELPGIVQTDPNTLGNDGWLVFGNAFVFDATTYLNADTTSSLRYNYFAFPAPNNPPYSCVLAG